MDSDPEWPVKMAEGCWQKEEQEGEKNLPSLMRRV